MITAEVSFVPVGTESPSLGRYIKAAIEAMKDGGVKVYPRAMATEIEAEDLETLFSAVRRGQEAITDMGGKRVIVHLRADVRKDKDATLEDKLKSIG